ncbi:MAG TPA: sigma-70 family RNA polymerase sigma factor [Gemmataceae bacterium]|jgi:RNA polymerase sigma factor (sigma-70 family)|nr:sigma-70 family RNA polymerase sigma factor [Gemmataceae bacterium]
MSSIRMFDAISVRNPAMDDCTDADLLRRFQAKQDGVAFAELVHRHGPMVYGTCRRTTGNVADADDAFQATFFILARKADSIRAAGALGSWLHGVAVRVARKAQWQALKRRVRQMAAAKPEAVPDKTPDGDLSAVIDEELQRLPDKLRQVILICDVAGKSRSQAARELGWPEGTVAKRLAKARQELGQQLSRRGVTLGIAAIAGGATVVVPNRLLAETITQALAFALDPGSGPVAIRILAEAVMRSMKFSALKVWVISGLIAMMLAGGGILLASGRSEPPEKKPDTPKKATDSAPAKHERISWKKKTVLETPGWLPASIAFSPDGKTMVTGGTDGHVFAYEAQTQKEKWKASVGGDFAAVAFDSDGKSVLATFKDGVRFLDPETGQLTNTIDEPGSHPVTIGVFPNQSVAVAPGQEVVSHKIIFGNDHAYFVKIWVEGGPPSTMRAMTTAPNKTPMDANAIPLAVDPAGSSAIITGPIDPKTGKNVLWAWVAGSRGEGFHGNQLLSGHEAPVVSAAWSKDGSTAVTGDAAGRIIVWDARAMKESKRLELGNRIAALAITGDAKNIAAVVVGKKAEFYVWETANPANNMKPIHADEYDYGGPIRAGLAFSPDGRQLSGIAINTAWLARLGDLTGKLHVWEIDSPKAEEKPADRPPTKLTWKADKSTQHPDFDLRSITVSPDGKKFAVATSLASSRFNQDSLVFATESGKELYRVRGGYPRFVGNDHLYTLDNAVDNAVIDYDVQTGTKIKSFSMKTFPPVPATDSPLLRAQISPDGKAIAVWFTFIIARVIDIQAGTELVQLEGQELPARAKPLINPLPLMNFLSTEAVWSPDSKRVAELYTYNDKDWTGGLAVWDAKTGKRVARFPNGIIPAARFMCFTFSPNGKWLAVGGLTKEAQEASSLTILDSESLKEVRKTIIDSRDGGADVTAVAYSPDGGTIAVAANMHTGKAPLVRILLCDAKTLEVYDTLLPGHDTPPISSLAFAPDGKTLIAATGWMLALPHQQQKEIAHRIMIWRGQEKTK